MSDLTPGTRVIFSDADIYDIGGTVVVPTDEEVAYCREQYGERVLGNTLVEWDDGTRAWHPGSELLKFG